MPITITKLDGKFRVSSPSGIKSKSTTKRKAERQRRLLDAIEHGFQPRKNFGINR